jgi:glucose/arabinose dehydrogenase
MFNRRRLLAATVVVLCFSGAPATAQTPQDVVVAPGTIASPTAMVLAPDGRIFVAQQSGALRVIKNGAVLSTPFVTVPVTDSDERGLLGVALDPGFAMNGWVYVYYTRESSPIVNRIVRFTANGDVAAPGSERVIFDNIPSESGYHNGGALQFGPDGKLYFAVGENHTSSNAQSTGGLAGKLHRINPDGTIPTDNPFYGTATGQNRSIWALGLRNPFTFDIQQGTGRIFVNDVGQNSWEELDEAWAGPNTGSNAGFNFGWPETEGETSDPRFHTPFYTYNHAGGHCAVTGGAFYDPATVNFPAQYVNDYFFADFCQGWIKSIDLSTKAVSTFIAADGSRSPVDIDVADDGSLYYLARGPGNVHRVRFAAAGTAPAIGTHPQPVTVPVGRNATFTVSASGTAPLSYRWQRDGADIPGATSASYTLSNAQLADDGARFRVVVSNGFGSATSNAATLTVTANQPPTASVTAPTIYTAGDTVTYSGSASDAEDGALGGSRFTWQIDFHHADHVHPFLAPASGSTSGSFTIPTTGHTEANVWYRIVLTVRDSAGLETTTYRDVMPRTAQVTLATSVPGLQLKLDGQPFDAPQTHTGVAGIQRTIEAPSPQIVGGHVYLFEAWSDGGAPKHTISTPAVDRTYTARFGELLPLPVGPTATPTPVSISAPKRTGWRRALRRGIPVRVAAPAGMRVRVALRRGAHRLAARTVTIDADGVRIVRLRPKARRLASIAVRRVLRIEVRAAGRPPVSRRIVLTR